MEGAEERKERESRGDPSSVQAPSEARRQSPWNSAALDRNLWVYTCRLGGDHRVLISPGGDSEDLIFAGFPGIVLAHLVPRVRLAIPTPVQVVSAGNEREATGQQRLLGGGLWGSGRRQQSRLRSLSFKEPPPAASLEAVQGVPGTPS